MRWPEWWSWELDFTPHLLKRMMVRGFNETDLRAMLENAAGFRESGAPGRWVVETTHERKPWHVIVEPIGEEWLLLIVTAYPCE